MNAPARNFFERALRILQAIAVIPLFFLLMLISLEIALGAHVISLWLRNENWKITGAGFDVIAVALVLVVAVVIVRFTYLLAEYLVRILFKLKTKPPTVCR